MNGNKIKYCQPIKSSIVPIFITSVVIVIFAGSLTVSDYKGNRLSATTEIADGVINNTQGMATSAANIFQTKAITLGSDVSDLVILLPNEAHESPDLPEEQRLIGEPYVPQNAIITPETSVLWLPGT